MKDIYLSFFGLLVVASYGIYQFTTPDPQDGLLFGSVIGSLGLMSGVKLKEKLAP